MKMQRILRLFLLPLATACDDKGSDTAWDTRPNLTVTGFYYEKSGSNYLFSALVENDGGQGADSFSVDLWLDRSRAPRTGQSGDLTERVNAGLPSGDLVEIDFTVPSSDVCVGCDTWVMADALDQVLEASEDDNVQGPMEVVDR